MGNTPSGRPIYSQNGEESRQPGNNWSVEILLSITSLRKVTNNPNGRHLCDYLEKNFLKEQAETESEH